MKSIHWILLNLAIVGSVALQYLGPKNPHPHAWDAVPLFYGGFGLAGSLLIILVSRVLGRALVHKPEGYYDEGRPGAQ